MMPDSVRRRDHYRRKHNVHPINYRTSDRRLICRECWDELTPETAARHSHGGIASWCRRCFVLHMRRLKTESRRRCGPRNWRAKRRAA